MSTRVNGVRFASRDLNEVYDLVDSFRPRARELQVAALSEFLGKMTATRLDRVACDQQAADDDSPIMFAWHRVRDGIVADKKGERHPDSDFGFGISIIVLNDAVLGVVHTERDEWKREFLESTLGQCANYDYYDGTDRPDEVHPREWRERGRAWARVTKPPRDYGFLIDMCEDPRLLGVTPTDVLRAMPSHASRVESRALDKTLDSHISVSDDEVDIFARISRAMQWARTPEAAPEREKWRAWVAERLVTEPTLEDIQREPRPEVDSSSKRGENKKSSEERDEHSQEPTQEPILADDH